MWFLQVINFKANTANVMKTLFIQCNTNSCYKLTTGGVNIYLYVCGSVLAPCVCALCPCMCVWYQIRVLVKKQNLSDLSKYDVLLHRKQGPSGSKVPILSMCRSTISLCRTTQANVAYQPFSQRNSATKRATVVEVGEEVGQNFKKGSVRGVRNLLSTIVIP